MNPTPVGNPSPSPIQEPFHVSKRLADLYETCESSGLASDHNRHWRLYCRSPNGSALLLESVRSSLPRVLGVVTTVAALPLPA